MTQGDTERLIVLLEARFDQFEKAMKAAERSGTRTFQGMQANAYKATTALERQVAATAEAMGKSLDNVFGMNLERANKSAKEAAAAFKEFDRARASVDAVRASVDPLFAASKRYEAAVEDLNRALALGVMTQAEYDKALEQVGQAYLGAGRAADGYGAGLGRLGSMSDTTKAKISNVGFQVQDVAVQMSAGASATQALSMQLPQLLGGFGPVGIVIGTLAAVGLPLLGAAFGSAGGAARSFDEAMGAVENSVQAVNDLATRYTAEGLAALVEKYGELNDQVVAFLELQRQATMVEAINATRDAMAALVAENTGWLNDLDVLRDLFGTTNDDARAMLATMQEIQDARTFDAQLQAVSALRERVVSLSGGIENMTREQFDFYLKVQDSEDALLQLAAAAPSAGWLSGAIAEASDLGAKLWDAVAAKLQLAQGEKDAAAAPGMTTGSDAWARNGVGFTLPGSELIPQAPARRASTGGGGGGGGAVDRLLADLQTEREAVTAWYAESQATLQAATDAQLQAIGGRHQAIERLEAEHRERLRGIREQSDTGALANAETFFGAMATLTAAGGDKLVKAARVFGAAEAMVNTYRAQAQVLADPSVPFWGKFAAAAAIGAAGFRLVGALGGGGGGGSSSIAGRPSVAAQAEAAAPAVTAQDNALSVIIQSMRGLDPKALFQGQTLIDMSTAVLKELGNRGIKLGGVS